MERFYIGDIEVRCRRTSGRNYTYRTLTVDHAVVLNAPKYAPAGLIRKDAEEFVALAIKGDRFNDLRDGGHIKLFGEKIPLKVYNADECAIAYMDGTVYLGLVNGKIGYHARRVLYNFYAKRLSSYLKEHLSSLENYVGLKCVSWKISDIYSAWGICNFTAQTVNFSVNLATKSPEFINAVIVHELAHLKFPNHGEEFYRFLKFYIPDYEKIVK